MKKYISERKWNKMFDSLEDGLCEKDENGDLEFTPDNLDQYMKRVTEMPDHQMIGVRYQIKRTAEKISDKLYERKTRRRKLGKLVRTGEKDGNNSYRVEKIPKNILFELDKYLPIIIRDYLRAFIKDVQVTGNCVIGDNPEGLSYFEATVLPNNFDFAKRWEDKVNEVADEFDALASLAEKSYDDEADYQTIKEKARSAFDGLAYIYKDLYL